MIPQAYTTRDMNEAYKWLQTLPPAIRDEIKSMEQAVCLYLMSKHRGGALPTKEELSQYTPPPKGAFQTQSSQDFQKSLKNLRHELEQFDFAGQPQTPIPPQHGVAPENPNINQVQSPQAHQVQASPQAQAQAAASQLLAALRLDPRSRQIVNEIRDSLNLSSDMEVIRMSLVLAHKSLKDLI